MSPLETAKDNLAKIDAKLAEYNKIPGVPYLHEIYEIETLNGWADVLGDYVFLNGSIPDEPEESDPPTYYNDGQLAAYKWLMELVGAAV